MKGLGEREVGLGRSGLDSDSWHCPQGHPGSGDQQTLLAGETAGHCATLAVALSVTWFLLPGVLSQG